MTSLNQTMDDKSTEPNIPYMVFEVLVAVFAVIGNALVILVFYRERRLRRRTNYYIVSLAIADLLVGLLGIPFAILASMGLPKNLYACLFTVSLLVVLCTISIFCLVAVSVDRYWAILYPMGYSRNVRTKTAIVIIGVCWVSGSLVGFLPLFGWHRGGERSEEKCLFTAVMDYNYLLFLYFATICLPALMMAGFYGHIYSVVLRQLRQIVTMNPTGGFSRPTSGSGTMLRVLGAAQKREVKATQNLSIIVFFFIVCWFPLYTINCVQAFCHDCLIPEPLTQFCIILSHVNSAVNPLLYAYHLRDFRAALKNLLYWMLGLKRDNVENCLQGTRFGSQNTLHNQRVNTLTRNYSSQSLQNTRVQHPLSDPSTTTTKLSCSSPLDAMISSVNSIHQTITSLGEENGQQTRKRMWTLTEVPSTCEEDSGTIPAGNGQVMKEYDDSCVQRRSVSGRSSGQVNSAYIEDGSILDYSEGEDVFVSASTSSKIESCMCVRKEKEQEIICVTCSDSAPSIFPSTKESPELNITNTIPLSKKNCISESVCNLDLSILSHCSLVSETEINNKATDDNEETELSPRDERRVIISSIVNSAEHEKETNCYPPSSPLRLSPLKIVGEFLFRTNSKKGSRLKNETSSESCECDGKSEDSESVIQRISGSGNDTCHTQTVNEVLVPTYQ